MRIIVRIRTAPEKTIVRHRRPNRRLASATASLLLPVALFCFAVCLWRWSYDLSWTGQFLVSNGLFSHWQSWFLMGGVLQILAVKLARYAGPEHPRTGLTAGRRGAITAGPGREPPQAQIP